MPNEALVLITAFADIIFVFIAARLGREWLLGTIAVNLILVSIFGAKLIAAFGLVTNVGNVFYGCVFLATYILLERYGKNGSYKIIWFGFGFIVFFALLSQLAVHTAGLGLSEAVSGAAAALFSFSPRIIFASIIAYIFAQWANILIYEKLKNSFGSRYLWLRANGANIISQFVDSTLFFTFAFFDLSGPLLVQAILAGWAAKIIMVLLGTPFLYLDSYLEHKK